MKIVLDSYAFKVSEGADGGCVLHLQPLAEHDLPGAPEPVRTPDGVPVVVMIGKDSRSAMAEKIRGSGVRPANSADMAKATKGIVGREARKAGGG